MEDKDMTRVELREQDLEQVAGGNFNWWMEGTTRKCYVNDIGYFVCTDTAKDTFAWLKAEHRGEGWTEQDYVNALLEKGEFTAI